MSREKRDLDYPVELETQFIMRIPEAPAKALSELIKSGETFKNRLTIQIENDMRHGEVRFDHWLLHAKIVDLPTIVESWKSVDRKSLYKTADICQLMICKEELDSTEDESPTKNKRKDPLKVDKKYLFPHGITPPTKNVRKRRFRKTLRKKCTEGPEIEKEVKRLLRADNEAVSFTWEIIKEEDGETSKLPKNEVTMPKPEKGKAKKESAVNTPKLNPPSKVEDIFGDALSDSDVEEENVSVDVEDSRMSLYDEPLSDTNSINAVELSKGHGFPTEFKAEMFESTSKSQVTHKSNKHEGSQQADYKPSTTHYSNTHFKMQQLVTDLEELKQRRQRTQLEIAGMENMTLRQRFQDILKTLNKEIITKEIEYHKLKSHLK